MEKFCLKCGSVANETATTCPNCGALLGQPAFQAYPQAAPPPPQPVAPPQPAPLQQPVPPPQNYPPQGYQQQPNYPPPPAYPQGYPMSAPKKKSSSAFKWILGILITLFVLAGFFVWAAYYAMHRVKDKIDAMASETQREQASVSPLKVPICSLLSANDVGAAVGVPIVAAEERVSAQANGPNVCVYTARGTADEMASKHMDAIVKQGGANADQQKTIEQFTNMLKPKDEGANKPADPNATTPVLTMDIDAEDARIAMKVFKALLGTQQGEQKISIGDEAFDARGSVLMVMKNGHLIRFTYATCPCGTDAIKPLAKKVADQL